MCCWRASQIHYPSVNCIGFWRLTAGSIWFSRSLLNSKASSTRNGFNNMSLWPHKMTQALWEASRFTRRTPRGAAPAWDERRWSCARRAERQQGRGCEGFDARFFILFWGGAEKSWSNSCWLESGAFRLWPFGATALWADVNLVLWSWCSRCFFAFSSYLKMSTRWSRISANDTSSYQVNTPFTNFHSTVVPNMVIFLFWLRPFFRVSYFLIRMWDMTMFWCLTSICRLRVIKYASEVGFYAEQHRLFSSLHCSAHLVAGGFHCHQRIKQIKLYLEMAAKLDVLL